MAITCNFDKDDSENRKSGKMIVRISPGQNAGGNIPAMKPVKQGAYMWVMTPRRSGKSWRDPSPTN